MSDVINGVPRNLLERLDRQMIAEGMASDDELRALLAAQPQASAAQSATAGEREAVARAICEACEEVPDHSGDAQGNQYRWQDYLPVAESAIAAWQRTQSAGVPDDAMVAVASAAYEREALAGATHEQAWHVALSEAIAAALAASTGQEGSDE